MINKPLSGVGGVQGFGLARVKFPTWLYLSDRGFMRGGGQSGTKILNPGELF